MYVFVGEISVISPGNILQRWLRLCDKGSCIHVPYQIVVVVIAVVVVVVGK